MSGRRVHLQRCGVSGKVRFRDEREATRAVHRAVAAPRGNNGSPEEIATVALFLASQDSSYLNGMELIVDGGTTAV